MKTDVSRATPPIGCRYIIRHAIDGCLPQIYRRRRRAAGLGATGSGARRRRHRGEFVVARVRLLVMALLMLAPTWNLIHHPEDPIHVTGFSVTLAASIAALAIWLTLRRGRWWPWIGFASSAFDISMVSTALVSFLIVASPMVALNSKVTFEMYFWPSSPPASATMRGSA